MKKGRVIGRQMLRLTVLISFLIAAPSFANGTYSNVLTYNFGMATVSVAENESSITQTDDSVQVDEEESAGGSAVSAMSFQLTYEFLHDGRMSYFAKATAPLMSGAGTGVFAGHFGFNKYLNDLGSKYTYDLNGSKVVIVPTFRYYWGAAGGIGYLIYSTESATKSDVFFDLSFHGGGSFALGDNWGLKGELAVGRTTGVATTGIKIEFFFGATFFI